MRLEQKRISLRIQAPDSPELYSSDQGSYYLTLEGWGVRLCEIIDAPGDF